MGKQYLAHIAEDGREQTVWDHLTATARLCETYAASFNAAEQGKLLGLAHDIGKCSEAFQRRLRGGPAVDHATAGAWECLKADVKNGFWAACCVAGHHGGLPDLGNMTTDAAGEPTLAGRMKKAHSGGIPPYQMILKLPSTPKPAGLAENALDDSFLIRMLYSCLVDADYSDTERFMTGSEQSGLDCDSLSVLLARLEAADEAFRDLPGELNRLRREIRSACSEKADEKTGLFSMTVPTGGGKTLTSIDFALRHALANRLERIIYVIPYTSIIEQTAASFRAIFGENNVLEHHSNAIIEVSDDTTEEQYARIRATENWDAPIIVTTAVQFFESLYASRPAKCRKLHRIARSVIVFDEAQMIPTAHLRPCMAAIGALVKRFGSSAVLCTATQPKLNDLLEEYSGIPEVRELCPAVYLRNDAFHRTAFRSVGKLDLEQLCSALCEQAQVLCIVNSRRAASTVFNELPSDGSFHLSTLMVPAHRRAVLDEIRLRLREGLPCRVVSTSLIEAGVDIDFPSVWRELAGLDSVLQAAGRCNREGRRPAEESVVTIFEGISDAPLLQQRNVEAARWALEQADAADPTAVDAYFSFLRRLLDERLDDSGIISAFEKGIDGCRMPFRTAAERFHLIDNNTKTVYIPLGEGAALADKLVRVGLDRTEYRRFSLYGVNIYERQYRALLNAGVLAPVDDDSAVLTDAARYNRHTGLEIGETNGQAFMI